MRHTLRYLLCLMIICILSAGCGKSTESEETTAPTTSVAVETTTAKAELTWQEQYDLGIRLLSEGRYEEAILAFQAAIRIDPKKTDTYLRLADAYIAVDDYDNAASAITSGIQQSGGSDEFDHILDGMEFLQSDTIGIYITDLSFNKASYLSGQPTDFSVSVAYRCPADTVCDVNIGANTEKPDWFQMNMDPVKVTDHGNCTLLLNAIPIHWDNVGFGIDVTINPEDAGNGYVLDYFTLYLNEKGELLNESLNTELVTHPDSPEDDLQQLFQKSPDAGLSIDDITLFGTPITNLTLTDAITIVEQNGYSGEIKYRDNHATYYSLTNGGYYPGLFIQPKDGQETNPVYQIGYGHFLIRSGGVPTRDPDTLPIWTGIRSLYTYATLEEVLNILGYENSADIAVTIQEYLALPYTDAVVALGNLSNLGFCCSLGTISGSPNPSQWSMVWTQYDAGADQTYSVIFEFDVAADCLISVTVMVE